MYPNDLVSGTLKSHKFRLGLVTPWGYLGSFSSRLFLLRRFRLSISLRFLWESLTEHTVSNYLFNIYNKLGISSRVELVLYIMKQREARAATG